MTNSSSIQMEEPGEKLAKFPEKLKTQHQKGASRTPSICCGRVSRALICFLVLTQLYLTLTHLVPFVFEDFNPWIQYCVKVFFVYLVVMIAANWLCVVCYSNEYIPSKDRPDIDTRVFSDIPPDRFGGNVSLLSSPSSSNHRHLHHDNGHAVVLDVTEKASMDRPDIDTHVFSDIPPDRFGGNVSLLSSPSSSNHRHLHQDNGHAVVLDVTEKGGLPWRRCKRCDMMVPPRCHHCKFCQRCMLRRDHHCFLVGCCIGHWNQRYFVVLMALGMVSGYLAAYLTITYLRHHHGHDDTLWNYFLPFTALQWVKGNISGLQFLLTLEAYSLCLIAPLSNAYFLSQISIIAQGKTLYEVVKKKNIRVTSGVEDNFRLVFGEYWLMNFLFPAVIVFKQTNDGLHFDGIKMGPEPGKKARDLTVKKARD